MLGNLINYELTKKEEVGDHFLLLDVSNFLIIATS